MWAEENRRIDWSLGAFLELAKKIVKSILLRPMN